VRNSADGSLIHYPVNCAASLGIWLVHDPATQKSGDGIFGVIERRRLTEIHDGQSHTLMFAEVKAYNSYFRNVKLPGAFAAVTARSHHPAGINACRADGSVSFLNEQIDPSAYRAFITRAGRDVVSDASY
jgi:uncharacterized protein DUF1559